MANKKTKQNEVALTSECLTLLLLFWGIFTKKTEYPLADGVLEKATELTLQYIMNNCKAGKFKSAKNLNLAKRCIRKCARLCNEMVEDDGGTEITVDIYIEAFKELQGVTTGPPVRTKAAKATGSSKRKSPPRGKFHGLLCQNP